MLGPFILGGIAPDCLRVQALVRSDPKSIAETLGAPIMGYRGSVGESARRTCDELEAEMAYVIVNDFEGGTKEQYDATTAVVHPPSGLPTGQTHHYAGPSANGWVVVAVWESKEIWEQFRDDTLLPAVQTGQSVLPGLPKTTEFEVEVEL